MKTIAIFAGNYKEFQEYMQSKSITHNGKSWCTDVETNYYYVLNEATMRGTRPDNYEIIGTFDERPDSQELLRFYQDRF